MGGNSLVAAALPFMAAEEVAPRAKALPPRVECPCTAGLVAVVALVGSMLVQALLPLLRVEETLVHSAAVAARLAQPEHPIRGKTAR
jgi:hypothetical protein